MDRAWLASRLEEGRSTESLARESGRSASTVAYWVNKHGLVSRHAPKHAARGGLAREELLSLVEQGLSIRAIADELGRSYTSIRHWLGRHGIETPRAVRLAQTADARAAGADTAEGVCAVHGRVTFVRRGSDGFRCRRCRTEAVERRRRTIKELLVAEAGGACAVCGYDRNLSSLHFHHVDRASKSFGLARRGVTLSIAAARLEAAKCVLLCSNCHAEVESGFTPLPQSLL